jgi:5-methylcytosine-specific restriction protein A
MKKVKYIIFRYLTSADFFNIYKPSGTEEGGGGQAYIDFPTKSISVDQWGKFFDGAESVYCETGEKGPSWMFPVNNIGLDESQELKIYQRRPQSICIASQRITSRQENRVKAWRPENGFPEPTDPTERDTVPKGLLIFITRTVNDEFWAGFLTDKSPTTSSLASLIPGLINKAKEEGYAGFIDTKGKLTLEESNSSQPFTT